MNYTAEPYVALVDQLLTGLTGGQAREIHEFFPGSSDYGLVRPFSQVKADTIKVLGQSSQAFTIFVPGRDWEYTPQGKVVFLADSEDAMVAATDAVWPDEGSSFFVSYYHNDSSKALLTDRNVGSVTRTLAEAFCRELAVLEKQLELVYQSGFIDTAKGNALDQVVAIFGLTRKGGDYAVGEIRLYRESAAPADIHIPGNTRVSTSLNPPVSFVTTSSRTLRKGQLSVEAAVRAQAKGPDGVVAAGAVTIINKAVHGITSVTNDAPTLFNGEKESDDELRQRAKNVMERAGRSTPGAIVNAVTSQTGLKENELKLVEDFQAHPGMVKLFIAREPSSDLAARVNNAVLASRPAGIRFEHNLMNTIVADDSALVSDEALREDDTLSDPLEEAADDSDFRMPVTCDILVYPENTRLSDNEKSQLKDAVAKAVFDYVDAAPIGGAVIFNQLVADVMALDGVLDIVADIYPSNDPGQKGRKNIIVPNGQRAMFLDKISDIQVVFVGAPVYFDFRFVLDLKADATLSASELEIKEKLVGYFSMKPGSMKLSSIDSAELQTLLQPSDLFTLDTADQHWTVEYEQAGLTIKELDETVSLSIQEQAVLRKIIVEQKD